MCNQKVGVAKRIDVENISQKVAALVKCLDAEVKLDVSDVKQIQAEIEKLIAPKP